MPRMHDPEDDNLMSRRGAVKALGALAGAALGAGTGFAQQRAEPPTTITNPPRDFDQPTTYFTDPDILTIDPSFNGYVQPQNSIRRLWTGGLWLEGPAWSGVGQVPGIQRHSEQPPDAVERRRRTGDRIS